MTMSLDSAARADLVGQLRLSAGFDAHIVEADAAFASLTGWAPEQARGETLAILFGPWSDKGTVDRLARAVERGTPLEPQPVKLYRFDGSILEALVSIEAAGDGGPPLLCRIQGDSGHYRPAHATASQPARRAPPSAERLLPVLIEALRDGVVVLDEEDRVLTANSAFAAMVGEPVAALNGRAFGELATLRIPPGGADETMAAATFISTEGTTRSATATTARGVDQLGHVFRVVTLRATAGTVAQRSPSHMESRADLFEGALLKRIDQEGGAVAVGLIEIVADDEIERDLGSIWRDTLERARLAAAGVLARELRAGEMYSTTGSDTFLVLTLDAPTVDDAVTRMQTIAQVVRHAMVQEGGAVAALEAFGGALLIDGNDAVLAHPRPNRPGELSARLVERVRSGQAHNYQAATVIADLLDEGTVITIPVRGRDMAQARFGLAAFDDRSRRWLAWLRRRHPIDPRLVRELDVALLGRVVERGFAPGDQASLILPLHYTTLVHAATADRMTAMVSGLSVAAKARLHALVSGLPIDLHGERLFSFVRRLAGFGRGVWLELDGLDARGIQGRQEGLAGVAFDYATLATRIEREPMSVKQFIERLRAGNQPVLVHGIEQPEQAALMFNTFGITLGLGAGVEWLAANAVRGR